LFAVLRPPATRLFGRWPAAFLRLGIALGLLGLVAWWVAGGVLFAGIVDRIPGDPVVLDAPTILLGTAGFVFEALVRTGGASALVIAVGYAVYRLVYRTSVSPAEAAAIATRLGIIVSGAVAATGCLVRPLSALAWMLQHEQVPAEGRVTT
jgi:hypothetical protein